MVTIKKKIIIILMIVISVFSIASLSMPLLKGSTALFYDSGRIDAFKYFSKCLIENFNPWIGIGTASSSYWGPACQIKYNYAVDHWMPWLHSDYLLFFFENGIIGLIIYLTTICYLISMAYKAQKPYLFSAFIGYLGCMLFNYPLHFPVHVFLGCLIVREIFNDKFVNL